MFVNNWKECGLSAHAAICLTIWQLPSYKWTKVLHPFSKGNMELQEKRDLKESLFLD